MLEVGDAARKQNSTCVYFNRWEMFVLTDDYLIRIEKPSK